MTGTLTLSQAAELSGHNKSKIHRAVKSGALSCGRDAANQYEIERSEFERVFPSKDWPKINGVPERKVSARSDGGSQTPFNEASAVLSAKLEITEARLAEVQETLARERERADKAEAERRALLDAPRDEIERERAGRERERLEAERRDAERKEEAERLRNDLERARLEQERLTREATELREALMKPRGFWARMRSR